jgi:hypothetical protein
MYGIGHTRKRNKKERKKCWKEERKADVFKQKCIAVVARDCLTKIEGVEHSLSIWPSV